MKGLSTVIWHGNPFSLLIPVDLVATALSDKFETYLLKYSDDLISGHAGKFFRHKDTSKDVRLIDSTSGISSPLSTMSSRCN